MSRPEDVPESVWDAARSLWFNDISLGADVDENIAHLARAIMDERAAERERCAQIGLRLLHPSACACRDVSMSRPDEDIPESVWEASVRNASAHRVALFGLTPIAASVWAVPGAIEASNVAFARAIMAERAAFLPALEAAESRLKIMAGMTGCRSDDDFVWEAQDLVDAALERARGQS